MSGFVGIARACLSAQATCQSGSSSLVAASLLSATNLSFSLFHEAFPVDHFSVALKVIKGAHQQLLAFPFRVVFVHKLVSHVQP